jgi:hypothetical protein
MLIVPESGKMILVTRAMEEVVIREQVGDLALWYGHADYEDSAAFTVDRIKTTGWTKSASAWKKIMSFSRCAMPRVLWLGLAMPYL